MRKIDRVLKGGKVLRLRRVKPPLPLPHENAARLSEAYRRALPALVTIDRYEKEFFARFVGALRRMLQSMSLMTGCDCGIYQVRHFALHHLDISRRKRDDLPDRPKVIRRLVELGTEGC